MGEVLAIRSMVDRAAEAARNSGLPSGSVVSIDVTTDSQAAMKAIGRGRSTTSALLNAQLLSLSDELAKARVLLKVRWVERARNWRADALSHPEDFEGLSHSDILTRLGKPPRSRHSMVAVSNAVHDKT